jgi:hypothetical protein
VRTHKWPQASGSDSVMCYSSVYSTRSNMGNGRHSKAQGLLAPSCRSRSRCVSPHHDAKASWYPDSTKHDLTRITFHWPGSHLQHTTQNNRQQSSYRAEFLLRSLIVCVNPALIVSPVGKHLVFRKKSLELVLCCLGRIRCMDEIRLYRHGKISTNRPRRR